MYPGCETCQEIRWLLDGGDSPELIAKRLGWTVGTINHHRYWHTPHKGTPGREPQEFCKRGHRMADTSFTAPWMRGRSCRECKRMRETKVWVDTIRQAQVMAPEHAQFYQQVGERIRLYREAAAWTQVDLADTVGISRHALYHIEDGTRYLKLHEFLALAGTLDVDPGKLL